MKSPNAHLALSAAEWAKRKNMGTDAIQHCRCYALEAERKMGGILLETQRAKPPNPKRPKKRRLHDVTDDAPTLAALGLTKRESAEAQMLAEMSQADFEKIRTGKKTKAQAKREKKEARRAKHRNPRRHRRTDEHL